MPVRVIRFGGNSFTRPNSVHAFLKLIEQNTDTAIIVVSAPDELQKLLLEGLEFLISGQLQASEIIDKIKILIAGYQNNGLHNDQPSSADSVLLQLNHLLQGIQLTGDFSEALKDQILSYAEKLSALLIQQALLSAKIDASLLWPEEIDLRVSDEYGNATLLTNFARSEILRNPQGLSVIPGSYGITSTRKIARAGLQAADYTAAALTLISGAAALELWEVDREFKTADEAIIPSAEVIRELTYSEASELSYFSEAGIHPRIVEPLEPDHIPARIFRLKEEGLQLTTTINTRATIAPNVVKSVVHSDNIGILQLNGPGVGFKPGILARVTTAFHQAGINIRSVITSQISINIILDKVDLTKAEKLCKSIGLLSVNHISSAANVSLVAIIGHGMQTNHGVSAKLFTAVANDHINVILSGSGASDLVSYLIIEEQDKQKAVKAIHQTFFKQNV